MRISCKARVGFSIDSIRQSRSNNPVAFCFRNFKATGLSLLRGKAYRVWALSLFATFLLPLPSFGGCLQSFLGDPEFEVAQVHKGNRFPNIVVAKDGAVLAFWNGVVVKRSTDGGKTWGETIQVGKGFMGGGVTINEANGDIFAFVEAHHPPSDLKVYRSQDSGLSWEPFDAKIHPDKRGHIPSMHMNEHGLTLLRGKHAGRLIRPSRHYAGRNHNSKWPQHYTNAIYSDDGGKNWQTSEPFPANGTGEATIVELSDGTLYYNSRRHYAEPGANPRNRWTAKSYDGGETWQDLQICQALPDGPQNQNYGLMGGLDRLPVDDKDILIFSNVESESGRKQGTVWASFDGGRTWPVKRRVDDGKFAYSSLAVGRHGTPSEGTIYLHYESAGGSSVARFNLAWLLEGETTGNGSIPELQ